MGNNIKKLLKNKFAVIGLTIIFLLIFVAVFASVISPYTPSEQNLSERLLKPSMEHFFGTDDLGRDIFTRMIYGSRISLIVGFISVLIILIIGTFLGIVSGFYGGKIDYVIMRFTDIVLCFPIFFLILLIIAFLEPNIYNVMIVIGFTSWPGLARLVRAEVLSLKEREFILVAKMMALSNIKIFTVHILPNIISPLMVYSSLAIGGAILTESSLSFLGLGVQPPMPSWGQILTSGKDYIYIAWWLSIFPGIAILLTVLSFNLVGEAIRDVFDPKEDHIE
ncbi:MAG: ABC transporter permease [Endomicrobiia bacterium]|jgi:peptide/nickel transport system permease protein|nr:ABC transporter permease [Endomicrobiaceae bacterium]MDD3052962.1 ABC transporter permease [Endomicrobiaceae bacterium]MDD3921987.1 ABC transporter permease [Endomicrobiaceae bacterium]